MKKLNKLSIVCLVLTSFRSGVYSFGDEIVSKNGSKIIGEVLTLEGGNLKVKTPFSKAISISWEEVAEIKTDKELPFLLKSGERIVGKAVVTEEGALAIQSELLKAPIPVNLRDITAINPPIKPPMTFEGAVTAGVSLADGNTTTRTVSASTQLEARAERHRWTLRGSTNYAENKDGVTARNSRASTKYDFFMTKRFYVFTSALFEGDSFQDLNLRTALSSGPGVQIVEKGDFTGDYLRELQLYAEAGLAYVKRDFDNIPDQEDTSARWSAKLDWPIVPKKVTMFHVEEGFPSLESSDDIYITTEQGIRFAVLESFFAAFQINWRWDNTPAPGKRRSDTLYMFNLGYNFSL